MRNSGASEPCRRTWERRVSHTDWKRVVGTVQFVETLRKQKPAKIVREISESLGFYVEKTARLTGVVSLSECKRQTGRVNANCDNTLFLM